MPKSSPRYQIRHPKFDFNLDELVGVFHTSFLCIIIKIGNTYLSHKGITTARQYVKALRVFAAHISVSTYPAAHNIRDGVIPIANFQQGAEMLLEFGLYIKEICTSSTETQHRTGFNFWLKRLAGEGFLPQKLRVQVKGRKGRNKVSKSLLEFELPKQVVNELELMELVKEDMDEARLLYLHIVHDLGDIFDIHAVPEQAAIVLRKRLDIIRGFAEEKFTEARHMRAVGLQSIRKGRKYLAHVEAYINANPGIGYKNPYKEAIQKIPDVELKEAFLAWCYYRNNGMYVRYVGNDSRLYNIVIKLVRERRLGLSTTHCAALIGAGEQLLISAYLMLIHDLVANTSSIQFLPVNADYSTFISIAGVDWFKPRANSVLTLLDTSIENYRTPPSKVVKTIRRATRFVRERCVQFDKNSLFIAGFMVNANSKNRVTDKDTMVCTPSPPWFLSKAKKMIEDSAGRRWIGTPKSIRISLLLYEALLKGVEGVKQAAQHSDIRTSSPYANKLPVRLQHDEKIRKFLRWLQALVVINIDDFPGKAGIDPDNFDKEKAEMLDSQFGGLHCKNPREGMQPGTKEGEDCGAISKCLTCGNRRNLFVASEENVTHLLLWNNALVQAKKRGVISESPEPEWLMWSLFISKMVGKLESDVKFRAVLAGAQERAAKVSDNPYLLVMGINTNKVVP